MDRRRFIAAITLAGSAGCLRLSGQSTEKNTGSPKTTVRTSKTGRQETSLTKTTQENTQTQSSKKESSPTERLNLPNSVSWPQYQFDHANTGHHPNTSGPKNSVDNVWIFHRQETVPEHRDRDNGNEWVTFIPSIARGLVYFSSQDDNIYAVDIEKGVEKWRFSVDTNSKDTSRKCTPAVVDGLVFAEGSGGHLYAIDAETGEERWRRNWNLDANLTQPSVENDTLYIDNPHSAMAVSISDGSVEWTRDEGFGFTTTFTVGDEAVFTAEHGPENHTLYALDKDTGETLWNLSGPSFTSAYSNGTVYTTSAADKDNNAAAPKLFAVDARLGTFNWKTEIPTETHHFSPPAVAEETVYIGARDGSLYAYDAQDGRELWTYKTTGNTVVGSPVVADGHVYFSTAGNQLVNCVTADDGIRKWTMPIDGSPLSPVVLDEAVFVGDRSGRVHALSNL